MFCKIYQRSIKLFIILIFMGVATNSCFGAAAAPAVAEPTSATSTRVANNDFIKSLFLKFVGVQCACVNLGDIQPELRVFFGNGIMPTFTPDVYFDHLFKGLLADTACYFCALIYMTKLIKKYPVLLNSISFYRLFLVSMVLAIKFLQDQDSIFKMHYYAKKGGVTIHELNNLEFQTFGLLNYDIYIKPEYWQGFKDAIAMVSSQTSMLECRVIKKTEFVCQDYIEGFLDFFYILSNNQQKNPRKYMIRFFLDYSGATFLVVKELTLEEFKNILDENVRCNIIDKMRAAKCRQY